MGAYAYLLYSPGSSSVQTGATESGVAASQSFPYACTKPAANTQNFCASLPSGYKISLRLPFAPSPACPPGMTTSACEVFKLTFANGVCDPNETSLNDPLDCGCLGALVADPYTGRCAAPASVCQVVAAQEANQNQRKP